MTAIAQESELLQKILADKLSFEEEKAAIEGLLQKDPRTGVSLLPVYVQQKHHLKRAAEEIGRKHEELTEAIRRTPWYPATFLRTLAGKERRGLVVTGNRQVVVALDPEIDLAELEWGRKVFLNADSTVIVGLATGLVQSGPVGIFSRFHDGRAVIKGYGDEEVIVEISAEMRERDFKQGTRMLYDRESLVAWEEVPQPGEEAYLLEEVPDATFDDIGGLDEVIEEVLDEINLHFFHPEIARRHHLKPAKGILLSGPPGVGKTMIAKALAHYLSKLKGLESKFLRVPPGIHRSKWYGGTEENIRELFRVARRAANGENRFCVMFFDDVDHLGARGDSVSTAIDTRVLPCFLDELDGLDELNRVLVIGATNRPDLLDEALLRSGRFGDRPFRIPRPGREAAREIMRKHLRADLPYRENGKKGDQIASEMIERALATMYAPNGELHTLAWLTFRDGARRELSAPQVMSGALIANAVREAKRRSSRRAARGEPSGIAFGDLMGAFDRELAAIAERLRPGAALNQMLDLPQDLDVVRVEVDQRLKEPRSFDYLSHG